MPDLEDREGEVRFVLRSLFEEILRVQTDGLA